MKINDISITAELYVAALGGIMSTIAEKKMLKRIGARTQPCLTPFDMRNGSEYVFSSTEPVMLLWNDSITFTNLFGQPICVGSSRDLFGSHC